MADQWTAALDALVALRRRVEHAAADVDASFNAVKDADTVADLRRAQACAAESTSLLGRVEAELRTGRALAAFAVGEGR